MSHRTSSDADLRAEAADILSRSPWWADQLRRERESALDELEPAVPAVIATDLDGTAFLAHVHDGVVWDEAGRAVGIVGVSAAVAEREEAV